MSENGHRKSTSANTDNNQATTTSDSDSCQSAGSTLQLNSTTINNNTTTEVATDATKTKNTRQIRQIGVKQKCAKFINFDEYS